MYSRSSSIKKHCMYASLLSLNSFEVCVCVCVCLCGLWCICACVSTLNHMNGYVSCWLYVTQEPFDHCTCRQLQWEKAGSPPVPGVKYILWFSWVQLVSWSLPTFGMSLPLALCLPASMQCMSFVFSLFMLSISYIFLVLVLFPVFQDSQFNSACCRICSCCWGTVTVELNQAWEWYADT